MFSYIYTADFWLITITLIGTFSASIMAFRLTTDFWFSKPHQAKLWLATGILLTALGAWLVHLISITVFNDKPTQVGLIAALCVSGLILATLLTAMLDLFLRTKKLSLNHSRENLSQMAMVDTLTQLPNRRALMQHLETATKKSEATGTSLAVAFIDLDSFKPINDTLGHQVGDEVLQMVAKTLAASVRSCDEVARIGGDEFIAIIGGVKVDEDYITIIDRMVNSIREIRLIKHPEVKLTASIGVAMYPRDGDIEQLISAADTAMYRAKKDGKNQYRFFDAEIAQAADQLLETQHYLKNAVINDEFKLHYQIKINSISREPVGAEALLHWEHPARGLLPSEDFMQAAERFGLSYDINNWVIEESCRTLQQLNQQSIPFNIAIHLSQQQLKNPNLVSDILEILKKYDLATSSVLFEISEAAAIKNESLLNGLLSEFKAANIKISIDNFGTQSSSLSYLQNLDINELKLDSTFISNVGSNQKTRGIIQAIIEFAHVLELNVVAEGIETENQRKTLVELGCDQMQGSLISRSMPKERFIHLLKNLNMNSK